MVFCLQELKNGNPNGTLSIKASYGNQEGFGLTTFNEPLYRTITIAFNL
tara:strand:- start:30 stop:176 length:147 start_codon:yes stop_codon:yes gene_type:complete